MTKDWYDRPLMSVPGTDDSYALDETRHGFQFGPALVTRLVEQMGLGVWIEVRGKRESIEIRVTHGGRLRVGPIRKDRPQRDRRKKPEKP